jgi:hypothetical protein
LRPSLSTLRKADAFWICLCNFAENNFCLVAGAKVSASPAAVVAQRRGAPGFLSVSVMFYRWLWLIGLVDGRKFRPNKNNFRNQIRTAAPHRSYFERCLRRYLAGQE